MNNDQLILSTVREYIETPEGRRPQTLTNILLDVIAQTRPLLADELRREIDAYYSFGTWRPKSRMTYEDLPEV